ncbi:solute carrier family 51 subunit beta isoform X2 [Conger conger]|uniref:solute carrier family 51 subunit beta isoform X2 n=1 Tax=Conger conger TaxID=82655 RepID=UPI002A5B0382|nr:solute carrier family 51 subunit beta isoform X2 [Conger conger]
MLHMWIVFCLLLQVVRSFMIYNTRHGLCLQDSSESVLLKHCDLDSHFQQWVWDHGRLLNKGTARCLSSHQMNPVLTASCNASEGLGWHCHSHWLISHSSSLKLTTDGKGVFLSHENKLSKWRSLVEGNICLESSKDGDAYEYDYEQEETMNEEQRNYYQWYYRSEDPSPWKYAMLVLSSGALLLGCLLLGMGTMANRNRKKIGQYKAAAASQAARADELQGMAQLKQACGTPSQHSQPHGKLALDSSGVGELRAGDVILKWKDGNVSTLYPDAPEEEV